MFRYFQLHVAGPFGLLRNLVIVNFIVTDGPKTHIPGRGHRAAQARPQPHQEESEAVQCHTESCCGIERGELYSDSLSNGLGNSIDGRKKLCNESGTVGKAVASETRDQMIKFSTKIMS